MFSMFAYENLIEGMSIPFVLLTQLPGTLSTSTKPSQVGMYILNSVTHDRESLVIALVEWGHLR